ncbi:MAG: M20/M25/M40 family metallo-hydrolase [Candidatus Polarisedimenticolia bacterium]
MRRIVPAAGLLLAVAAAAWGAPPEATGHVRHALEVRLDPPSHRLAVTDTITLPAGMAGDLDLLLNARLEVRASDPSVTGVEQGEPTDEAPLRRYRVRLPAGRRSIRLTYEGPFDFALSDPKEEYTRGFRETLGIVGPEGVYLAGDGYWYPHAGEGLIEFEMKVRLPDGWRVVSQGEGTSRDASGMARWDSQGPAEEIFLVGGPLELEAREAGPVRAEVYLRGTDDALTGKYLDATALYLKMYTDLIGPYPYGKFAMVENFWETGYGMPSFTLLGPQIIRFPFILHSSYPHEILHSWWGNGVFVQDGTGNWCEGLTAYMADHLIQEQRGKGDEHRRATLQKYRDYVQTSRDFALRDFRSRHSAATEAVGYGRTMMGFHMLHLRVGDEAFRTWVSRFYARMRGKRASFDDVRAVMEEVSGQDLRRFFADWIERPGAPALAVEVRDVAGLEVRGVLRQTQAGPAFQLDVSVVVQTSGAAVTQTVRMDAAEAPFSVKTTSPPLALHVDPSFDLFRRLDPKEAPPSIGQIFGEPAILAVLPSDAPEAERTAYRSLIEGWRSDSHAPEIRTDAEVTSLPSGKAVWMLGRANRLARALKLPAGEASLDERDLRAHGETMPRAGHSTVLVARHPSNPAKAIGWIVADPVEAVPGLGRKLPHYGRYSYLGFEGNEPTNVMKGEWAASDSPMRVDLRPAAERSTALAGLKQPQRAPLAEPPAIFSEAALREHVARLSAPDMEGRGLGTRGLDVAAAYIARQFEAIGLAPGGDAGSYLQQFRTGTTPDGKPRDVANVIGVLPGTSAGGPAVVVGAHYDHLGYGWPDSHAEDAGRLHPGADDNASGVAVLLELARAMVQEEKAPRTIVFVAFTGEEAGRVGSRHYVDHPVFPLDTTIGMLNLDAVGRLGSGRLSMLATGTADEWPHIARGVSYVTGVESRLIPESLESSDQKSFIDRGVPAVQLFTEPHPDYHRPGDTADKVDAAGLVKVASFVRETLVYLAGRTEPLTVTIAGSAAAPAGAAPSGAPAAVVAGRRVSLGTVPDFMFAGPGVKVSSIVPGSAAEKAGLRAGDVLLRLDDQEVSSLRAYSDLLKTKSPGQQVRVTVMRDGAEVTLAATLTAR